VISRSALVFLEFVVPCQSEAELFVGVVVSLVSPSLVIRVGVVRDGFLDGELELALGATAPCWTFSLLNFKSTVRSDHESNPRDPDEIRTDHFGIGTRSLFVGF
jgi:hypothetical protein